MIAESAVIVSQETIKQTPSRLPLSLNSVAASLQVLLATRRAARNAEHAYWYTIARGL